MLDRIKNRFTNTSNAQYLTITIGVLCVTILLCFLYKWIRGGDREDNQIENVIIESDKPPLQIEDKSDGVPNKRPKKSRVDGQDDDEKTDGETKQNTNARSGAPASSTTPPPSSSFTPPPPPSSTPPPPPSSSSTPSSSPSSTSSSPRPHPKSPPRSGDVSRRYGKGQFFVSIEETDYRNMNDRVVKKCGSIMYGANPDMAGGSGSADVLKKYATPEKAVKGNYIFRVKGDDGLYTDNFEKFRSNGERLLPGEAAITRDPVNANTKCSDGSTNSKRIIHTVAPNRQASAKPPFDGGTQEQAKQYLYDCVWNTLYLAMIVGDEPVALILPGAQIYDNDPLTVMQQTALAFRDFQLTYPLIRMEVSLCVFDKDSNRVGLKQMMADELEKVFPTPMRAFSFSS